MLKLKDTSNLIVNTREPEPGHDVIDVVLVLLLLTLKRFHTLFWYFCLLALSK